MAYHLLAWTLLLVAAPFPHATAKALGSITQKSPDDNDPPDVADGDGTTMFGYGCDHYDPGPPAETLRVFRNMILDKPHPMFLLSEMAESYHRNTICNLPSSSLTQQLESRVATIVTNHFLTYLNNGETQQEPCPSRYNITYNPNHYPRYQIEVICSERSGEMQDCHCSHQSSGCFKLLSQKDYHYLKRDTPVDTLSGRTPSNETWKMCSRNVGVGCSCPPQ